MYVHMAGYVFISFFSCYTSVIFAQLSLGSPGCIDEEFLPKITCLMSYAVEFTDPVLLREYEEKEGLIWGTFIPYLGYLYTPPSSSIPTELHIASTDVLLHTLINTLGRKLHFDLLCKENLLEYTSYLPSIVCRECQPLARRVVNELGKHTHLQPPSLSALARARLATLCFGLQEMVSLTSVSLFVSNLYS